jgi:hypothetical protein
LGIDLERHSWRRPYAAKTFEARRVAVGFTELSPLLEDSEDPDMGLLRYKELKDDKAEL